MYMAALAPDVVDMGEFPPGGCRCVYGSDCGRFAKGATVISGRIWGLGFGSVISNSDDGVTLEFAVVVGDFVVQR